MNTYQRQAISFTHGQGVYLFDQNQQRYLDAISGVAVTSLGHAHPAVTVALQQQAGQLLHTSNLYNIDKQQWLAEALIRVSGMDNVFFANSGAEANEAAIKIARLYGHQQAIENPQIVVMDNAFHGRTMATLTASGNAAIQEGFAPLLPGFIHVPYGNYAALEALAQQHNNIVAVLFEPLQGEAGVRLLPDGFLQQVRELCDQQQWLMMLDEVQTGNGRTGCYFAYQHENILPDVMTTAKGLGNGVPIGACLAHGRAAGIFVPGKHGSTFGGNPLACAAGLAVVAVIEDRKLCDNAKQRGEQLLQGLREQLHATSIVKDIRGKGLMVGIELDRPCAALVDTAREAGLLINVTAGNVIRLLPPLIIDQEQVAWIVEVLSKLVKEFV